MREVPYRGGMKTLAIALVFALAATTATGCIVDNRPRRTTVVKHKRGGCPPAHHWNGRACVHNGKAKGHRRK